MKPLTAEEEDLSNSLFEEGWQLIEGLMYLDGDLRSNPGWFAQRKIRKSISLFEQDLQIDPKSWQTMLGLGKAHQLLGNRRAAYDYFMQAHHLEPNQTAVLKEAVGEAAALGRNEEALVLAQKAVALNPDDQRLVANLSVAFLLAGYPEKALLRAKDALRRDPHDAIMVNLLEIVEDVLSGKRPCPSSEDECF